MSRSRVSPPSKGPDAPAERGAVRFVDDEARAPAGLREAPRKKPWAIPPAMSGERVWRVPAGEHGDAVVPDERMPHMREPEERRPGIGGIKANGRVRFFLKKRLPGTSLARSNRRTDGGV